MTSPLYGTPRGMSPRGHEYPVLPREIVVHGLRDADSEHQFTITVTREGPLGVCFGMSDATRGGKSSKSPGADDADPLLHGRPPFLVEGDAGTGAASGFDLQIGDELIAVSSDGVDVLVDRGDIIKDAKDPDPENSDNPGKRAKTREEKREAREKLKKLTNWE